MSLPINNPKNASFDDNNVPSLLIKDASTNETVAVSSETPLPTSGNISSSRLTSISDWDIIETGSGDTISSGGNTNASRYISIAKSNLNTNQITILASKKSFKIPAKINLALTSALAVGFNEFFAGIVKVNSDGSIATETLPTPLAMPATISVTSNVATVVINNHGLRPNARVAFRWMARSAFNINAVQITIVDANTFTFPLTITNGTYNAGGFIEVQEPGYNFAEFSAMQWINAQTTGLTPIKIAWKEPLYSTSWLTLSTLIGTFASSTIGSDAVLPGAMFTITARENTADWQAIGVDSASVPAYTRRNQLSLDPNAEYKVVVFVRNNGAVTRPVARITSVAKSGTTTATVTTDVPHGLTVDSTISTYGVLDLTNFPNLTTAVQVASVPTANTFTCVIGSAVTATSSGGSVILQDGWSLPSTSFLNFGIKNISRTNGITLVDVGATASGLTNGEKVYLHGLAPALTQYEGLYRVYAVNSPTNAFQLIGLTGDQSTNYGVTPTGGSMMKACDYRIHWGDISTFTRQVIEQANYLPVASESLPVVLTVNPTAYTVETALITPTLSALTSAATTNATSVKTTGGTIYNIVASNTGVTAVYLKIYNKASAPTVGTDIPVHTCVIPAGGNYLFDSARWIRLSTGIAFAITNLIADTDTTAVAASQVKVAMNYI